MKESIHFKKWSKHTVQKYHLNLNGSNYQKEKMNFLIENLTFGLDNHANYDLKN